MIGAKKDLWGRGFTRIAGVVVSIAALLITAGGASAIPLVNDPLLLSPGRPPQDKSITLINMAGRPGAEDFKGINAQYRRGDFQAIADKARQVIADRPESGLAYEVLGTALYMLDKERDAFLALKKASQLEPEQSGPYAKLGIIHMKKGRVDQAEDYLQKALQYNAYNRNAHQHLGLIYEYKKDYPNAILHYRKGLEGTGNAYVGIALNLARLLNAEQRYDEAIAALEPRLPMDAKIPEAQALLAASYFKAKRFEPARERFARALALEPDAKQTRLGLAMAMRNTGDARGALMHFEKLIADEPDWRPAIMEYGETLLVLGRLEEARKQYARGVALGSNPAAVERRIAVYHINRKEFDAAEKIYRKLVASGKANVDSYAKLSEIHQSRGQHDKGLAVLRQGLKQYPANAYLQFRLGSYLASLRRYSEAIPALQGALKAAPDDPLVLRTLSLIQAKSGDNKGSLENAARLYTLRSDNIDAAIIYATRLEANGEKEKARDVYQRALAVDPDNVLALNNLAGLLAGAGELAEAEAKAARAAELAPDNGMVLDTLGWIQHRRGDNQAAFKTLARANVKLPDNPVILYHLGAVCHAMGRNDQARTNLERALKHAPDFKHADEARQLLESI